jgi:hypothetical protein
VAVCGGRGQAECLSSGCWALGAVLKVPTSLQVGRLAAVGEPDPNAQVVVGELTGWVDLVAEQAEQAEPALLARDNLPEPDPLR